MKSKRQAAILELVTQRDIYTQADLTLALEQAGYTATQSTVSRDIRELRLTKITAENGLKYAVAGAIDGVPPLDRIFRDGVTSVDYAGNMLVLRTLNGLAMAVALALDNKNFPEILGTVAGEDAVICVVKTEEQAAHLTEVLA